MREYILMGVNVRSGEETGTVVTGHKLRAPKEDSDNSALNRIQVWGPHCTPGLLHVNSAPILAKGGLGLQSSHRLSSTST